MPPDCSELTQAFFDHSAKIGIIGLGYVGLPLALASTAAGYATTGFDIDPTKINRIEAGETYLKHISSKRISDAIKTNRFAVTSDYSKLRAMDAIIICVPTPLTAHREPDLSYVVNTTREIAKHMRKGQLIALESTTWPGTTEEVMRPILEETGLKSGEDFFLAFSPEREDPGNADFSTTTIPKIVGADGPKAQAMALAMYNEMVAHVVPVSSTRIAEAVKITENVFRAVNIALVNELKIIYDAMGIDVWEVIEAAKTKPFGYMAFYPGPGLGGHCIPIDPFYLTWKAREHDICTRFIELAGEINTRMPNLVVEKLLRALDEHHGCGLRGAHILLLGIAYKKNVDDMRESPALKLMELLEERGAITDYYDPHVVEIPPTREHKKLSGRQSISWDANSLSKYHAVLIATDHDDVDYLELCENAKLVIDTRNACARAGASNERVVKA